MASTDDLSLATDATEEVQRLCTEIKPFAEKISERKFAVFIALVFKTQVKVGTNYFIKVYVGGDEFVHLRVWKLMKKKSGEKLEAQGIQAGKTFEDPIVFFG